MAIMEYVRVKVLISIVVDGFINAISKSTYPGFYE